ncbi:MAG: molybdopterin converting factor subunit 1 [Glaciecola sp.]
MTKILFFAGLREELGTASIDLQLEASMSAEALRQVLSEKGDNWQAILKSDVLVAINHTLSDLQDIVQPEDEVAFFPPVTGG